MKMQCCVAILCEVLVESGRLEVEFELLGSNT